MQGKAFHQIFSEIEKHLNINKSTVSGAVAYFKYGYTPSIISKVHFANITKRVSDKKVAFVDGGNSLVINTSSVALGFIRVATVIVEHNKCKKTIVKQFFALATTVRADDNKTLEADKTLSKGKDARHLCQVKVFAEEQKDKCIADFIVDAEDKNNEDEFMPSKAIGIARRLSEIMLAKEVSESLDSGEMVVIDGSLRAFTDVENFALQKLYDYSMKKNVLVCAISKTCSMITDSGDSLMNAVSSISDANKIWYYYPLAESLSEMHKAEIFLVKLNKKSEHIFLFEIYKEQAKGADYPKIIGFLAYMSRDLTFPGYPYWLIKADQMARVPDEENATQITRFFTMNKQARKMLLPLVRAVDAHSILDNIR
jgi:hypothetical protein